jgi:hypothetical protein
MALTKYNEWREFAKKYDEWGDLAKELITEEIDKEIISDIKKMVAEYPSFELIESEEIVAKPMKFMKVNAFNEQDWMNIKGVGAKLAKKLVEGRMYMCIDDIAKVKGVGKNVLENIKNVILDENIQPINGFQFILDENIKPNN